MTYADQAATDRTVCGRFGGLYRDDRSGLAFLGRRTGIHSFSQANSLSQIAIPDFAGNGPRGFAASGCQWRLSDTIRERPRLTLANKAFRWRLLCLIMYGSWRPLILKSHRHHNRTRISFFHQFLRSRRCWRRNSLLVIHSTWSKLVYVRRSPAHIISEVATLDSKRPLHKH